MPTSNFQPIRLLDSSNRVFHMRKDPLNNCSTLKKTPKKQEAHGPRAAHLSDIAMADMQMLCNIFPILSSQLMKRSSFKQFFILKKKIYGMPVNWAWSFEQNLNGSKLGFTISTILAIFDLQATPMLPTKFRVNWPFSSGEEAKDYQDGCHGVHLGFPIGTILATFDLQVTLMLPSKFGVNWPFGSGEEAKNRFWRWRPSWISDQQDFSYFWSTSHPDAS